MLGSEIFLMYICIYSGMERENIDCNSSKYGKRAEAIGK